MELGELKRIANEYESIDGVNLKEVVKEVQAKQNFEKLTMPLDLLVNALSNGVAYINNRGIKQESKIVNLVSLYGNHLILVALGTALEFKDFQKTWWLKGGK